MWKDQWHNLANWFWASSFWGATRTNKFHNYNFHRDSHILLIITNQMIYICYIIYCDNVAACVLIVRDNELSVKDDNDVLSEVAEGRAHAGRSHGWA